MNHSIIEKKCIIIFCVLYGVSTLFFGIVHYGLYDSYKRIIECYHMRLRASSYKKMYEATMILQDNQLSHTYVNRASHYLKEHTLLYLKNHGISLQELGGQEPRSPRQSIRKKQVAAARNRRARKTVHVPARRVVSRHAIFKWPLRKTDFWLSSFFGPRRKPDRSWGFHYGIDMAALKGTPVYAAGAGTITYAGYQRGYGNTILITHSDRYSTRYAHLDTIAVSCGMHVSAGKMIGTVGDTGYTITRGRDASHLHFEVSNRGKQVNPLSLLEAL